MTDIPWASAAVPLLIAVALLAATRNRRALALCMSALVALAYLGYLLLTRNLGCLAIQPVALASPAFAILYPPFVPFVLIPFIVMALLMCWYVPGLGFWGSLWRIAYVYLMSGVAELTIFLLLVDIGLIKVFVFMQSTPWWPGFGIVLVAFLMFRIAVTIGLLRLLCPQAPWAKVLVFGLVVTPAVACFSFSMIVGVPAFSVLMARANDIAYRRGNRG